jgi:hypothetical protein
MNALNLIHAKRHSTKEERDSLQKSRIHNKKLYSHLLQYN